MPIVRIEISTGFNSEYRKAILDGVHTAIVESLKVPESDRNQKLYELDSNHFDFPEMKYSKKYTHIEITLFKGRTLATKKMLYEKIVRNLGENPGISGNDITIILHEVKLENWGIRGGQVASEVNR